MILNSQGNRGGVDFAEIKNSSQLTNLGLSFEDSYILHQNKSITLNVNI